MNPISKVLLCRMKGRLQTGYILNSVPYKLQTDVKLPKVNLKFCLEFSPE